MRKTNQGKSQGVLIWVGGFAPVGGIETFVTDLSVEAVRAGFQVDMLAWDSRSKLLNSIRRAGVRLYCSPWRWGCRWTLPDWLVLPLGIFLCRRAPVVLFGKTVTHTMHNILHRFGRRRGGKQRFIYVTPYRPAELWGGITREAEKREVAVMLSTFDLIVCQNAVFADDLRSLGYHGPLEMLPNLPPPAATNPAPYPEGPLTIGFLGRMEYQKNLPELLNVFALLLGETAKSGEKARPLRLRLIGEGSLKADLMKRAQELGIAHSVDFYGAIPRERVKEAIQSCQLFCFTSHTEGQPIASLEILAEGRPIIATAVGAFPNMLTDLALGETVPPRDTAAFLSAVTRLLARQKSGLLSPQETVRAYGAKFDREAAIHKYMELLSLDGAMPERARGATTVASA